MNILKDQSGAALILAVLMIGLLAVIGVFSAQLTTTEEKIARNDKLHKVCLHEADGGAQIGIELLEKNIRENPFTATTYGNVGINTGSSSFYTNPKFSDPDIKPDTTSTGYNAAIIPPGVTTYVPGSALNPPVTTILFGGGPTTLATGAAIQMVAGYEQMGKGAAKGGAWRPYDVRSRHQDVDNSDSTVSTGWRHVIK